MRRRVRRGKLAALFWRSRHGAVAKATLVLAAGWKLLGAGWRDERGSVVPMVAVLGTALIGFAALAVDVGIWEGNAGVMQGAADQAALAAGLAMSAGSAVAKKEAKGIAAAHGFVDGTGGVVVTPTIPLVTGSYVSSTNAIEVVITQTQTRFLSGVYLNSSPLASVRAVAVPSSNPACLVVLAQTGYGITSSGTTNLNASNCNVYINSASTCDVSMSGTSKVTGVDAYLGAPSQAGCNSGGAGVYATSPGTVHYGASATDDPYGSPTPPPAPCKTPKIDKPLDPGTYCGLTLSGSQSLTLTGGVYIFTGGINLSGNSQITGYGATLVFTGSGNGGIISSGNTTIRLDAPATGTTAGIALWFDKAVPQSVTSSGILNLYINGGFDAPGSKVTLSGIASSNECMQLIVSTLTLSGSGTLNFGHTNCSNYGVKDVGGSSGYKLME